MLPTVHQVGCSISVISVYPHFTVPCMSKGLEEVLSSGGGGIFLLRFTSPCEQMGRDHSWWPKQVKETMSNNLQELKTRLSISAFAGFLPVFMMLSTVYITI